MVAPPTNPLGGQKILHRRHPEAVRICETRPSRGGRCCRRCSLSPSQRSTCWNTVRGPRRRGNSVHTSHGRKHLSSMDSGHGSMLHRRQQKHLNNTGHQPSAAAGHISSQGTVSGRPPPPTQQWNHRALSPWRSLRSRPHHRTETLHLQPRRLCHRHLRYLREGKAYETCTATGTTQR